MARPRSPLPVLDLARVAPAQLHIHDLHRDKYILVMSLDFYVWNYLGKYVEWYHCLAVLALAKKKKDTLQPSPVQRLRAPFERQRQKSTTTTRCSHRR